MPTAAPTSSLVWSRPAERTAKKTRRRVGSPRAAASRPMSRSARSSTLVSRTPLDPPTGWPVPGYTRPVVPSASCASPSSPPPPLLVAATPAVAAWDAPARASRGPLPAHSPDRGDERARRRRWPPGCAGRAATRPIVVSLRPAGQGWGEPVAISRRGRPAIDPVATIDPDGGVVVLWRQVARAARHPHGRRPPPPGRLRGAGPRQAASPTRAGAASAPSRATVRRSARRRPGSTRRATSLATWHWGTGTSPAVPGFVGEVQFAQRPRRRRLELPAPPLARPGSARRCAARRSPSGPSGHAVVWWQCDLAGGPQHGAVGRPGGARGRPRARDRAALPPAGRRRGRPGRDHRRAGRGGERRVRRHALVVARRRRIDPAADRPGRPVDDRAPRRRRRAAARRRQRHRRRPLGLDRPARAAARGPDRGRPRRRRRPRRSGAPAREVGGVDVAVGDGRQGAVAWFADGRVSAAQRASTGELGPGGPDLGPGRRAGRRAGRRGGRRRRRRRSSGRATSGSRTVVERAATSAP